MMSKALNPIKKLAGDTAIYGLGTIVPRLLNYALTPFYTRTLIRADYAIQTEIYALIAILLVFLTYGMETAFFRYCSLSNDKKKVFSTSFTSILITSIVFFGVLMFAFKDVARWMEYADQSQFIFYAGLIVIFDALAAIPFAYLREQNKPMRFSLIKIFNVVLNIILVLFLLVVCPDIYQSNPDSAWIFFYNPAYKVEYIFIANILSSGFTLLLLTPEILTVQLKIDKELWRKMIKYAFPVAIVIMAGMMNEVADKLMMKHLLPQSDIMERRTLLGEYGANFKLAILMSIFIQMFRFAAEPFFFSQSKESNSKEIYALVMKYFVIFGWMIFLGVLLFLDQLKIFISEDYHNGLTIVPIVLLAKLLQGVFYNLSVWYKLTNKTGFGAMIAISGTLITISVNYFLVPIMGYQGAAIGQLSCYGIMVILSFVIGRQYYKVDYPWKEIFKYSVLAITFYYVSTIILLENQILMFMVNALFFLSFIGVAFLSERKKLRTIGS